MKALLSILLLWFISLPVDAQYFSRSYDIDNDSDVGSSLLELDDGYIIQSLNFCKDNTQLCMGMLKTDLSGNLIWKRSIDSLSTFNNQAFVLYDGMIYSNTFLTTRDDGPLKLMVYEPLAGELEYEWGYAGGNMNIKNPNTIIPTENGFYLNWLQVDNGSSNFLTFIDKEFNIIREFPYTDPVYSSVVWDLYQDQGKNFIASYVEKERALRPEKVFLFKMDTLGRMIWKKEIFSGGVGVASRMTPLQDGSFVISWKVEHLTPRTDTAEALIVLQQVLADSELGWRYTFWDSTYNDLAHLITAKNGDIVGTGLYDQLNGEPISAGGWIFRMSSNGELKWQRKIFETRADKIFPQRLLYGKEGDSGDLVFVGELTDTNDSNSIAAAPVNIWLLKLDSVGCLTPNCTDYQLITSNQNISSSIFPTNVFSITPNPSSNYIKVSCEEDDVDNDWEIQIYNEHGKLMYFTKYEFDLLIDVEHFSIGTYFVKLIHKRGYHENHKFIKA